MTDTTPAAKPTNVLLNLVLDGSGSMHRLRQQTLEGVNAFVEEQMGGEGTVLVSLTIFNTEFDVRAVGVPIQEFIPLGQPGNPYGPRGGTALYDAVVATIHGAQAYLDNHPDFDGDVVTVIQTDGQENSSTTATLDDVNTLINQKSNSGRWEFVFMGTGNAAWTEGEKFTAIPQSARFAGADDADSYRGSYATASAAMTSKRQTGARYDQSLRAAGAQDLSQT